MQQALDVCGQELGRVHGGRASPGMLELVEVPGRAAGERPRPLKAFATVTARSAQLLVVTAFNPDVSGWVCSLLTLHLYVYHSAPEPILLSAGS
jgi:ribosome recycling factor